jgi:hypothetical protein
MSERRARWYFWLGESERSIFFLRPCKVLIIASSSSISASFWRVAPEGQFVLIADRWINQ